MNVPTPPLTVREVANLFGVSDDVVRDRIRKKQLRAGKVGGQWRIRREDFAEYMMATFEKE
jgi:excisionase family DNA binding protein